MRNSEFEMRNWWGAAEGGGVVLTFVSARLRGEAAWANYWLIPQEA